MQKAKHGASELRSGLMLLTRGIAYGVFVGSLAALLLPSIVSVASLAISTLSNTLSKSLNPWLKSLVAPAHATAILLVVLASLALIFGDGLLLFVRRCYTWSIYEATLLWGVATYLCWAASHLWLRLLSIVGALLLTCAIAWCRSPRENGSASLIDPDRPIERISEDRLDRKTLILSLVHQLLADAAPVIALVGAYGDGKTSVLNLLAEELHRQNIVLVRFKSSLPGDDLTLASTLFNSIGKQLHRAFFVRRLGNVLRRFARKFSGLVPSAPSGLRDIFEEPSQEDELHELTDRLQTLPIRRVVVLLDDMDRMQGGELRMLLKIIRASDAYPKLSFVCAFNKKALVDALIRHQVTDHLALSFSSSGTVPVIGDVTGQMAADDTRAGYEYLEKFFPVQIPVPKMDDAQLAREFDARFNKFAERQGLSLLPSDTAVFEKEFNPLWKLHFRPALNNLRKMNTYFNALNASFVLVKREVNVIDFMCIELLRQVEPEIYEQVFRNRSLFYYPEWDIQRWDERIVALDKNKEHEHLNSAFDQIFRNLQGEDRETTLSLLGHLFPKLDFYHRARTLSSTGTPSEVEADKQKRIYHPDYFPIYFSLHVQEGYVGTEEIERFIAQANSHDADDDAQKFLRQFLRELSSIKRYRFFDKLIRFGDGLHDPQAKALALSIALESDKLEVDDLDIGDFGTATRLVLALANRFKETHEITEVLEHVIAQAATDAFAQRILQFSIDQENNKIFEKWDFVDAAKLKTALSSRLKSRYFAGGDASIYGRGTTWRDWQALLWWARDGEQGRADVIAYLEDEFERRPSSIAKHIQWLWPSVQTTDGRKVVDDLFPLKRIAELAKKHGSAAASTETEKKAIQNVIREFSSPMQSNVTTSSTG